MKSSKVPFLLFWGTQFVVWFPMGLDAFIRLDKVFFFSCCCIFLFLAFLPVVFYRPTTQILATKESLFLPTRIQKFAWKDVKEVKVWEYRRCWGRTNISIRLQKNWKVKTFVLFGIKEDPYEIERILNEFLAQSQKTNPSNIITQKNTPSGAFLNGG